MKLLWITLKVSNMEKSLNFYQNIVGLSIDKRFSPGPGMEIVFLREGETAVELICSKENDASSYGNDISMGFEVESLDKFSEFLTENNISIKSGPFQPNPHVKFLYVEDPDGMKIQFVENM